MFQKYPNLQLNNLKTRTAMNAKISVFVICDEAIIYLLLYNSHDWTFRNAYEWTDFRLVDVYLLPSSCNIKNSHLQYLRRSRPLEDLFALVMLAFVIFQQFVIQIFVQLKKTLNSMGFAGKNQMNLTLW